MSAYFVVPNDLQELEFYGEHLGHASTERDSSVRWTEIDIYRTDGGNYVVVRLGQSLVYHTLESGCTTSGYKVKGDLIHEESEPCEKCNPGVPEDSDFNPEEVFIHEKMMSSAEVVENASKVTDALSTYDKHRKMMRISSVANEALHQAASKDPTLLNKVITRIHVP